jgi:hypothetical protein
VRFPGRIDQLQRQPLPGQHERSAKVPYAHAPRPIKQTLLQRALLYTVEQGIQVASLRLLFNITQNTISLSIPLVTEDGICWEPAPRERTGPEVSVGSEQRQDIRTGEV